MSANLQGDWQSSKIKLACRRAKGPHPAPKNIFSSQGSSSFWCHNWCNMIFHPLVSIFDNDSNSLMLAMLFQILHEHRLWFSSMDHEACSIFSKICTSFPFSNEHHACKLLLTTLSLWYWCQLWADHICWSLSLGCSSTFPQLILMRPRVK